MPPKDTGKRTGDTKSLRKKQEYLDCLKAISQGAARELIEQLRNRASQIGLHFKKDARLLRAAADILEAYQKKPQEFWVVTESTYGGHEGEPFTAVFSSHALADAFATEVERATGTAHTGWRRRGIIKVELDPSLVELGIYGQAAKQEKTGQWIVLGER